MKIRSMIEKVDDVIATIALSLIIVIIASNVFFRFVLSQPLTWSEEISLALFVWLTFIGISSVMKRNEHVGIDYFIRKLPKKWFHFIQWLRWFVLILVTSVVFIYWGFLLMIDTHWKVTPVLGIDFKLIYVAIPLGGLLAMYHLLTVAIRRDKSWFMQEEGAVQDDDSSHR
ncbi:C4-dicarboxylate ABC transporter permease [Bacillaceae bacterium JMAK1]|nr:C4-dicarboxylate ABC transporter permease [Bacillaceae bacterium JMAK1]